MVATLVVTALRLLQTIKNANDLRLEESDAVEKIKQKNQMKSQEAKNEF